MIIQSKGFFTFGLAILIMQPHARADVAPQTIAALQLEVAQEPEHLKMLEHPLILGASVSAGLGTGTHHPIAQVLEIAGVPAARSQVLMRAAGGMPSPAALTLLRQARPNSFSWIAAIDVFYWDSLIYGCPRIHQNIRAFFEELASTSVPYLVGTVPAVQPALGPWNFANLAGMQQDAKCMDLINTQIKNACVAGKNCILVDLQELVTAHRTIGLETFFAQRDLFFKDSVNPLTYPDGIHANEDGARVIALLSLTGLRDYFRHHHAR